MRVRRRAFKMRERDGRERSARRKTSILFVSPEALRLAARARTRADHNFARGPKPRRTAMHHRHRLSSESEWIRGREARRKTSILFSSPEALRLAQGRFVEPAGPAVIMTAGRFYPPDVRAMRKPGLCGRRAVGSFRIARPVRARALPSGPKGNGGLPSLMPGREKHHKAGSEVVDNYSPTLKKPAFFAFLRCFSRFWGGGFCAVFTPIPGFAGTSPVNGGRGSQPHAQCSSSPVYGGGVERSETEGACLT